MVPADAALDADQHRRDRRDALRHPLVARAVEADGDAGDRGERGRHRGLLPHSGAAPPAGRVPWRARPLRGARAGGPPGRHRGLRAHGLQRRGPGGLPGAPGMVHARRGRQALFPRPGPLRTLHQRAVLPRAHPGHPARGRGELSAGGLHRQRLERPPAGQHLLLRELPREVQGRARPRPSRHSGLERARLPRLDRVELRLPARDLGPLRRGRARGGRSGVLVGRHDRRHARRRRQRLPRLSRDLPPRPDGHARPPATRRDERLCRQRADGQARPRPAGVGQAGAGEHGALPDGGSELPPGRAAGAGAAPVGGRGLRGRNPALVALRERVPRGPAPLRDAVGPEPMVRGESGRLAPAPARGHRGCRLFAAQPRLLRPGRRGSARPPAPARLPAGPDSRTDPVPARPRRRPRAQYGRAAHARIAQPGGDGGRADRRRARVRRRRGRAGGHRRHQPLRCLWRYARRLRAGGCLRRPPAAGPPNAG